MPYILNSRRDILNPAIAELIVALRGLEADDFDGRNSTAGNLNYIITSLISDIYTGKTYDEINTAVGILESVKAEYNRRIAAPYENQKCYDNSDVYPTSMPVYPNL